MNFQQGGKRQCGKGFCLNRGILAGMVCGLLQATLFVSQLQNQGLCTNTIFKKKNLGHIQNAQLADHEEILAECKFESVLD